MESAAQCTDQDPQYEDYFGARVHITSSGNFMISSMNSNIYDQSSSGKVYLFNSAGENLLTINNPSLEGFDNFGF